MNASLGASRRHFTVLTGAVLLFSASANAAVSIAPIKAGDRYFVSGNMDCVPYTRRFVPSLPYGLTDYKSKLAIINSTTPRAGSAAIMSMSEWGHVAVVVAVDNSGSSRSILLAEHNVPMGTAAPRYRYASCGSSIADCLKQLKIVGFYRP
jgi:hypothetical protein